MNKIDFTKDYDVPTENNGWLEEKRFKVALAMLPEMARECYEEGLEMSDAVSDAVRYADMLIKELAKKR